MSSFVHADIFINEFLPNSVDKGYEWIELFNNGTSAVSLSGFNVSEESASQNFTIGSITISSNGFIVLAQNETIFNQTYNLTSATIVEYGPSVLSLDLNDGNDSIFLYNASGSIIDSTLISGICSIISERPSNPCSFIRSCSLCILTYCDANRDFKINSFFAF